MRNNFVVCPACNEKNNPAFSKCWKCGFIFRKAEECSKEARLESIGKQFLIWYHGCMVFIQGEYKKLLNEPRVKLGACLFFMGSIDYLCQNYAMNDEEFGELCIVCLEERMVDQKKEGYPKWLIGNLLANFYAKKQKTPFALQANLEGGKRLAEFLTRKNPDSPYVFFSLVNEWAKNPNLDKEDIILFNQEHA